MEYDLDMKLEPPDSPDTQGRFIPELDFNNSSPYDDLSDSDCQRQSYGSYAELNCDDSSRQDFCSSSTMFLDEDNIDGKEVMKRYCLVCGDVASGLHYGVASCEACKAFFKRTIQGGIEYSCPANGSCEITRQRRKACQACRFKKCLDMGMLREGVRPDRVRGGRQKYRRTSDHLPSIVIRTKPHVTTIGTIKRQPNAMKIKVEHSKFHKSHDGKLLSVLRSIEPEKVYAMPDRSYPDDELKLKVTLSDLTDRELVATIGWSKQVPGFSGLSVPDQMNLLRSSWLDIVCLNIAFRSIPYNGDIIYADDFKISEEDSAVFGLPPELDRVTRKLIQKLTDLKVNYDEYLLLKAFLLFNPDSNLDNLRYVQKQRDSVYELLLDYEGGKEMSRPHRVYNLLLILPLLVHTKFVLREFWLEVSKDENIMLHKLLREMLDHSAV